MKPERSAAAHCGAFEYVSLHTLRVEMKPHKKAYKIGDTAKIDLKVTRTFEKDPTGSGTPLPVPYSEPAQDVFVGVGLRVGDVFLFGLGMTDADGQTTVDVVIQDYATPGWANVDGFAQKITAESPCLTVQELGFASGPRMFKILK